MTYLQSYTDILTNEGLVESVKKTSNDVFENASNIKGFVEGLKN